MPAVGKAERARLFLQVGELAAGHLVQIDLRRAGPHVGLEGGILHAHRFPVVGQPADRSDVEAGVALGVAQGLDDRSEVGLRGHAGHGVHGRIDCIDAGFAGGEDRGGRNAAGVVGVEMDRQPGLLLQRLDQDACGLGLDQPAHVFEAQNVSAGGGELAGDADIIVERVFRPGRVEDVAGVADGGLENLSAFQHRVHGDAHVLDPVQAVEHAEHVDAARGRAGNEGAHHIVRIDRIADTVSAAQQHLKENIRRPFADALKPLPRAFLQEPHGDVEGRAAPAFQAEQLGQVGGIGRRRLDDVVRAEPGGEQ